MRFRFVKICDVDYPIFYVMVNLRELTLCKHSAFYLLCNVELVKVGGVIWLKEVQGCITFLILSSQSIAPQLPRPLWTLKVNLAILLKRFDFTQEKIT